MDNSKETTSITSGVLTVILAVVCFIGFIVWNKYLAPSAEEEMFKEALPMSFNGTVDSVYRDKWNHNVKKVILSDKFIYGIRASWENNIDLGDSLVKHSGSLTVEVFKTDGRNIVLDYRQLAKSFHKTWWER